MYLNEFAQDLTPRDMTRSAEFASLLESAADLGIAHASGVRYVSRHTVVRSQRFHFSEWGEPGRPQILLLHGGNQSAHSWDLVSLHLSDRYHVFALDQRGHGDSTWAPDGDYRLEDVLPGQYRLAVVDVGPGHRYTRGLERSLLVRPKPRRLRPFRQ